MADDTFPYPASGSHNGSEGLVKRTLSHLLRRCIYILSALCSRRYRRRALPSGIISRDRQRQGGLPEGVREADGEGESRNVATWRENRLSRRLTPANRSVQSAASLSALSVTTDRACTNGRSERRSRNIRDPRRSGSPSALLGSSRGRPSSRSTGESRCPELRNASALGCLLTRAHRPTYQPRDTSNDDSGCRFGSEYPVGGRREGA